MRGSFAWPVGSGKWEVGGTPLPAAAGGTREGPKRLRRFGGGTPPTYNLELSSRREDT